LSGSKQIYSSNQNVSLLKSIACRHRRPRRVPYRLRPILVSKK